jgi:WD domain, G-beta repeat
VAHEALLRLPPLSDWLAEDREFLIWRDRLGKGRAAYEANARGLLVGRELQIARDWLEARDDADDIAQADRKFIAASAAEEDRRRTEEDEKERQRQAAELLAKERERSARTMAAASRRLARRTMEGLVVALVLALLAFGAGLYAYQQQQAAVMQAARALAAQASAEISTKDSQLTQSRFLTPLANQAVKEGDAATGMLLALEALPDSRGDDELKRTRPPWGPAAVSLDLARRTLRELAALKGHTGAVYGVAMSPDGARIVTGSRDNTARVWDAKTFAERAILRGHTEAVLSVTVSPDGARIVTGSIDSTARVWDARTFAEIATLKGHDDTVWSVAVSPNGARIVTGSADSTARVWDAKIFAEIVTLKHMDKVRSVAVSPDGTRIVTGSNDNTARVWDAKTFAELAALKGHTDTVTSVSVTSDGARVITGSADSTARVWELFPFGQALVEEAKVHAPRCLTPAERQRYFLATTPPSWCIGMQKWPYDVVSSYIEGARLLSVGGSEQDGQAEILFAALLQRNAGAAKNIDETWANAYVDRGGKLLKKSKDEEAMAQFALALQRDAGAAKKVDETWANTYVDRGGKLLKKGKDEEAMAQFALALQRNLQPTSITQSRGPGYLEATLLLDWITPRRRSRSLLRTPTY